MRSRSRVVAGNRFTTNGITSAPCEKPINSTECFFHAAQVVAHQSIASAAVLSGVRAFQK